MPVALYEASISVFIRGLTNLSAILKKGEDYANEKGLPHEQLLQAKLHEKMFGLIFQIQRASDCAKGTAVRVGPVEPVAMPDEEKTFADLQSRIQKTIDFLKGVDESRINSRADAEVDLHVAGRELKFTGTSYVLDYAVPNFFFHVTTAYAILRMAGVPLGKFDYLGSY